MQAYAPGSVTTVFVPPSGESDRSRGGSAAIQDGVVVDVAERVGERGSAAITVDGEGTSFEPVSLVLERLDADLFVDVRPEVPIGCGFGASGAATLAAALAANAELGLGHSRDELVEAAHAAEVEAGTGLGDVFVQERGGVVVGTGEGIHRIESDEYLEYASFGGIATSEVLGDEVTMERVREAGRRAFARLPDDPSLSDLVSASWPFARETGLVTERVEVTVERVRDAGGEATMAMLGETVVATGVEGVLDEGTRVCSVGAHVL